MARALRAACVQLSPVFKDPPKSRERADRLIAGLNADTLDLLVLPEMAFTGYCFESRDDIEPYVEDAETGETKQWAERTARMLNCYVLVGVPTLGPTVATSTPRVFYNSLLVVAPTGALAGVYHKHHLYGTLTNDGADYLWATPGEAFVALDLPFPSSSPHHAPGASFRLVPGICMDLNEKDFAPTREYALASFAARERADVLVVAMSWLDSEPPLAGENDGEERDDWVEVRDTLSYWVMRCAPLLGSGAALVAANRVGREGETVFTGSSCAVELGDRPAVVQYASKRGEEVLLAEVELPERTQ
ncbi:hypothetical protein JCM10450v2_003885 [Rhodotorula kratochvilovae]